MVSKYKYNLNSQKKLLVYDKRIALYRENGHTFQCVVCLRIIGHCRRPEYITIIHFNLVFHSILIQINLKLLSISYFDKNI